MRSVARLRGWLPAMLALTAGSPYFQLTDTGYASYRNIVTARWPTGGPPPAFTGYADYQRRIQNLIDAGVISDPGMIYYDVRPSHRYPTLEIRIADACPLIEDVVLVAALARALVVTAANAELRGDPPMVAHDEILRAATWKAARSGLTGQLVDPVAGQPVKAPELLRRLIVHVQDVPGGERRPGVRPAGRGSGPAARHLGRTATPHPHPGKRLRGRGRRGAQGDPQRHLDVRGWRARRTRAPMSTLDAAGRADLRDPRPGRRLATTMQASDCSRRCSASARELG